jgi:hypothetical protein
MENIKWFKPDAEIAKKATTSPQKGGSNKKILDHEFIFGATKLDNQRFIHFAMDVSKPYLSWQKEIYVKSTPSMVTDVIGFLPNNIKFSISFFGKTAVEITENIQ